MSIKSFSRLQKSVLFRDSFWSLLGNIIGKGFSLIAGIVVARLLGKEVYGEYGIIKSTLLMIALFSSFGLGITATKFIAEAKEREPQKLRSIQRICNYIAFAASGIIALCVIVFAKRISVVIEAPHLKTALQWTAIAIIFNSINTTQIGVLGGFKAYAITARNNILAGSFTFITTIPLTYKLGFDGAITALILSLVFNCLINRYSIHRLLNHDRHPITQDDFREIISFSLPIALQESLYSITSWLSSFVLIKLAGYGELGIYNAAAQWMAVMAFVPGALRNVALSHLSTANHDTQRSSHILKRLLQINFTSTFIPCLFIWLFSSLICSMYGSQYNNMRPVLNVMVFSAVINSLSNIITQELIALNQNWYLFFSRFLRDFSIIIIAYFILKKWGGGALSCACISLSLQIFYLVIISYKYKTTIKL